MPLADALAPSGALQAFVSLCGESAWNRRVSELCARAQAGSLLGRIAQQKHALELALARVADRTANSRAGGVLGGISTGQPVVARFAVKPTSSILNARRSVDRHGREVEVETRGRHDPCVGIRAVPVGEAMLALVLADHLLRHRAQNPDAPTEARLPRN